MGTLMRTFWIITIVVASTMWMIYNGYVVEAVAVAGAYCIFALLRM